MRETAKELATLQALIDRSLRRTEAVVRTCLYFNKNQFFAIISDDINLAHSSKREIALNDAITQRDNMLAGMLLAFLCQLFWYF